MEIVKHNFYLQPFSTIISVNTSNLHVLISRYFLLLTKLSAGVTVAKIFQGFVLPRILFLQDRGSESYFTPESTHSTKIVTRIENSRCRFF